MLNCSQNSTSGRRNQPKSKIEMEIIFTGKINLQSEEENLSVNKIRTGRIITALSN